MVLYDILYNCFSKIGCTYIAAILVWFYISAYTFSISVKTDESLFLLATSYFRSGQKDHAYQTLKDRTGSSSQCRYLFGMCAYELEK